MNPIGSKYCRYGLRSLVGIRGPLAIALTILLAGRSCLGGSTISETPHPSVARITALERNAQALGSGTLIDTRDQFGLVITNYHVIRDATGDVLVTFPNGFQSKAQVLQVDKEWDLAALVIWRPNLAPVTLATVPPRPGDRLAIAGYGSGSYRAIQGRCTQYVAPSRTAPHEMVELSVEARQGDSGGPIFNEHGELAGVLFGAGGGTTAGSWAGRVRVFLGPLAAGLGQTDPIATLQPATLQPAASQPAAPGRELTSGSSAWSGSDSLRQELPRPESHRSAAALASLPRNSTVPIADPEATGLVPVPPASERLDSDQFDPTIRPLPAPEGHGAVSGQWDQERRSAKSKAAPASLDLRSLVGGTIAEQAKTALALVGILAFLFQFARLAKRE